MAIIYQKGTATVAVRDEDVATRRQLESDGWQAQQAPATRGIPRPQAVTETIQPAMPAPDTLPPDVPFPVAAAWSPDLPANLVALLEQQFGTPGNAAAASDDDLFRIGGMTPGYIMAIRKPAAQG